MRGIVGLVLALVLVVGGPAVSVASPPPADLVAAVRTTRGDDLPTKRALTDIAAQRAVEISRDFDHAGAGAPWPWGEIIAWNTYPADLAVAEAIRG